MWQLLLSCWSMSASAFTYRCKHTPALATHACLGGWTLALMLCGP